MLMLDGAESPDFTNAYLRLTLQPDPIITGINADSRSISVDDINEITIMGMNVGSVSPSEINITLGSNDDDVCTLRTSSNTEITCRPPTKPSGTRLALRVRVGRNLVFPSNGTTGPEWTLEYTSTSIESSTSTGSITSTIITTMTTTTGPTSTSTSAPSSTSIGAIVGGSIAASVIMTLLIVAIPLIFVILILQKRTKDSKEKPIPHEGNVVMPMSMNIYQGITSQDSNLLPQSNPAYVKASDIHKTPAGKNEEFVSVKKANNDDDDDANQVNQEDQDNEGHIDTGVIDDIAQSSEDKGSYKNIPK
ncbi:PREDICTED: uncharacterized protein LOC109582262 [Amphimedon queenslandica]|uniref:IPT/TIG domain-containing protein n=1 Tax=Amphimedon queenslandica TaxID=400682 RepID=A0AAN0J628_AMPQE|nr:PREDICTED: uncharacterized protein LOC109582262 [Amphimedon queenslandica]|eukprot:XP_019852474.1 PREDICTED: uncharacterized protein LOC109582262 [Amphimedon queenslandica]